MFGLAEINIFFTHFDFDATSLCDICATFYQHSPENYENPRICLTNVERIMNDTCDICETSVCETT